MLKFYYSMEAVMQVYDNPSPAQREEVRRSLRAFAQHQNGLAPSHAWAVTGGEFPKNSDGTPNTGLAYQLLTGRPTQLNM